jgi:type IV secretion system protein VirB9
MDPRRLLTVAAAGLALGGCALLTPAQRTPASAPQAITATPVAPESRAPTDSGPPPAFDPGPTARPYPEDAEPPPTSAPPPDDAPAHAAPADTVIGGVQVFGWREGRIYTVRTAPLRVTVLALAPGEAVTAKAAGDTVRWQIGEAASGQGPSARTHVLIKPLQSGLETNLVLTTTRRVYLLTLRSGSADAFNAAVAWDYGAVDPPTQPAVALVTGPTAAPDPVSVTPEGPVDARYRITPEGRAPRWTPVRVFNDGVRTVIVLPPRAAVDEIPAVFIRAGRRLQLVNYRQAGNTLVVDRLFDAAELRLGADRPEIVRIRRLAGAAR